MAKQLSTKARRKPGKRAVREQLRQITESPDFDTSARTRDFLRFVVEESLKGNASRISQSSIARGVFGREEDFNPLTDPIVRMQAGRVRQSLERYYLTAGKQDPIAITIPKGAYAPVFQFRQAEHPRAMNGTGSEATGDLPDSEPRLMVVPFQNLSRESDYDYITQGLAPELAVALDRYQTARVMLTPHDPQVDGPTAERVQRVCQGTACFLLKGTVAKRSGSLLIAAHLLDARNGVQCWANELRCTPSDPNLDVFVNEFAQSVAAAIADEQGIIAREITPIIQQRKPAQAKAHEAMLRVYHFEKCMTPKTFRDARVALENATQNTPESGIAWTGLARLQATNYGLEFLPDEILPIEKSIHFAETGVRLNPEDQRAWCILSLVQLLGDNPENAKKAAERAFELNPTSLFFLDIIGYLLTLAGDWEQGPALMQKAVRLNPFSRDPVYCALWLDAFKKEEYEQAHRWAKRYMNTANHWPLLMKATTLAHMGQLKEAKQAVAALLQFRPTFKEDGHRLISRYVKFTDIVEQIESGLQRAGLELSPE